MTKQLESKIRQFLASLKQVLPNNVLIHRRAKFGLDNHLYDEPLKFIADLRLTMDENCWVGKKALELLNELKAK